MQIIPMSKKELARLPIVNDVIARRLKQKEAAMLASVSERTIRRWKKKVMNAGPAGLTHGNRARPSSRKVPARERTKIRRAIQNQYADFGPTLVAEQLAQRAGLVRDPKTIRTIMIQEGLWLSRAARQGQKIIHRHWRERKNHLGELVQFDGSYHDWLEGRNGTSKVCLLAAIDDATGQILRASFAPHEGTLPVMDFWTRYASCHGLPAAIYLDRFSTYKMTQELAGQNPDLKTQLERACQTLGVKLVFALSPQAKGRVERLFKTLQDRLVKELRLQKISTLEEADHFLSETFIPDFNLRYAVPARAPENLHRTCVGKDLELLPETLCRMEERIVQNDFTISFKRQWYQLLKTKGLAITPKDIVTVREYPDETRSFSIRHKAVLVREIMKCRETGSQRSERTRQALILAPA